MTGGQPDAGFEVAPVKFSRLAHRGLLLGLSVPQVASLSVAVVVFVTSLYLEGGAVLWWTSPIWAVAAAVTWLPIGGRKTVEWIPVALHWARRVVGRQTVYRRRIVTPRPAGTLALPGDAAAMRQYLDPETGAVLVHDPHHQRLIAIAEITHRSFVLLDAVEQQRRVDGWGRVLSTTCRSTRLARLQVLERTLPDSGSGLARWWAQHGTDDQSWVARTYAELIARAGPAAERHVTTLSLALDIRTAARAIRTAGGGMRGAAAVLRQEMHSLTTALQAADLAPVTWYGPGELAVMLRGAYDPQVAATLERAATGAALATAGPVAVTETWEGLRSDSSYHAVLWVCEWPRTQVYPGFLAPVLLSSGVRRSFSLICDPIRADVAARDIRRKKTEYISDAAQRAKIGQIEDAQQSAEYYDVLQQEADLTAGHGVLRYTGLLAISAETTNELDAAVAEIEQAAIQASCETRRLVGQQAQAFVAAALPLCRGI
ncbi:PrgI family protein [Nitriliruptoraceae bacterium ZYF776]|nr:PrgI family protein [Profundirhabdus halotolerans]